MASKRGLAPPDRPGTRSYAGGWIRAAPLALAALLVGGCGPGEPAEERLYAFGTLVELQLHDTEADTAAALADRLAPRLKRWHRQWHPWNGQGLARVNHRLAQGRSARLTPDLAEILRRAERLATASGHRFNPAVGALVKLWGFGLEPPPEAPPPPSRIRALVAAEPRLTDLKLEDGQVSSRNDRVQIDLGAFAKGVAVARSVAWLRRHGVRAGIVNAGGDLQTFGSPAGRAWRIGVRRANGPGAFATLRVRGGESVFTSGSYERGFTDDGVRYHHILDPRTGYPARGVRSVTVLHPDPAVADAAATAIFVAGPEHWQGVAAALGVRHVMRVTTNGRVHVTPAMEERLSFPGEPPKQTVHR